MNPRTAALAAALVAASAAIAGDLNPPPGPIAPTGSTLTEIKDSFDDIATDAQIALNDLVPLDPPTAVETLPGDASTDHVISQPGRYVVTRNHFSDGANDVIKVTVSDVEIDFQGFLITADAFYPGTGAYAVDTIGGVDRVTIRDASISVFGDSSGGGIRLNGEHNLVEDVRVAVSQGTGIQVGGSSVVLRCVVYGAAAGFSIGDGCSVRDCQVQSVSGFGMSIGGGSAVENCVVDQAGGAGYVASTGAVLAGCVASRCGGNGFELFGAQATQSAAYLSGQNGFDAVLSTIAECHASESTDWGFRLVSGNRVSRCTATDNDTGGFQIAGVRNHVSSNASTQHLTGTGYQLLSSAVECFLFANFSEANASNYDIQAPSGMFGSLEIDFTGANSWSNFSN